MLLDKSIPAWALTYLECKDDPLRFVTGVIGAEPEPWAREALAAIRDGHKRIAIRSGHGVGKSTFLAWLVIWAIACHKDVKVPFAANSQNQLRDVNWPEIAKWVKHMPPELAEQIEVTAERVMMRADPELSFAVARTCSKEQSESLAGFHAGFLSFLIDEASGIDEIVFEVAQGALSTPGSLVVMTGNPTRNNGYFYDAFHKNRANWYTMRVNSEDVPRARGHIQTMIDEYGKDSNAYRVRVLGEFPLHDDDVLISLENVLAATTRDIRTVDVKPVWAVDPARFGSDRSTLCKRRGNELMEKVQVFRMRDTMTLAGIIASQYHAASEDDRPSEIAVDVIGLGAGVVDRLDELGLPVRAVNVAESPSIKSTYLRLRDELWFKAKDWFEARDCKMPVDDDLIAELVAVKYTFTSSGKMKVESKDEMKKRGLRSPDLADAFIMTFACDTAQRQGKRIRSRLYDRPRASAWGA